MKRFHVILGMLGLAAVLGVVAAACSGSEATVKEGEISQPQGGALAAQSAQQDPAVIHVHADEFSFTPRLLELTAGQPVQLVFHNHGKLEHDLAVTNFLGSVQNASMDMHEEEATEDHEETGEMHGTESETHMDEDEHHGVAMHVHAMPGETESTTVIPESSGTYTMVCTVPGHKEAGMVGELVVQVR
ncbi:MAG: hypothetical protein HYX97_04045 [Chloroflexi bacterium]|nr:hypothetical protein [Chloroflexota bacterium]